MTRAASPVLVTGGTGFIGSHVARCLADAGWPVRALARPAGDARSLESAGVEVARGDLRDPASLGRAVAGCAGVLHVAALVSSRLPTRRDLEAVNVEGTRSLAAAAVEAGVRRFVQVSTCGVYGSRGPVPASESARLEPDTAYRISKARGERAATDVAERTALGVVVARICAVLGPGGSNWLRMCRSIADGGFRRIGDGQNRLHFAEVSDVVDGLVRCLETSGIEGRAYNLAGPAPITLERLVDTLAGEIGVAPRKRPWPGWPFRATRRIDLALSRHRSREPRRLHSYDLFLADHAFDISRARRELGYEPRVAIEDALRRLVRDYRRAGVLS